MARRTRQNPALGARDAATQFANINNAVTPTEFRKRSQSTALIKTVVPAYHASHGWVSSGAGFDATNSNLNDTADVLLGDRALKIVSLTTGAAAVYKTLAAPVDVSDCDLRLRFKYDDANLGAVQVTVGNSNFSQASSRVAFTTGGTIDWPYQRGRWNIIDIPQAQFSAGAVWSAIQRVQVQVSPINDAPTTVHLSGVEFVKRDPFNQGPVIVFSFDDSYIGQHTIARQSLQDRGWKGTLLPIVDRLDSGVSAMSTAQVQDLHDTYGWEVGGHSYSNASHALGLPAMSSAQRVAELESIQAWQDSLGFRPSTFAYPLGHSDAASQADVTKYYTTAMTAFAPMLETMTPARRFAIPRVNVGTQQASLASLLTSVVASKGLMILCVHDIVASGGTSNDITTANWNTLIANVETAVSNGAKILRADEALGGIR